MANANLPEEVIEDILFRLPPESLTRFKSVHKSWYHLINNPKFVSKHLINSLNSKFSNTTILLKRLVEKGSGIKENILSFITYPITDDRSDIADIELPCYKDSVSVEICGQSHGIVCLSDLADDIYLCNPATREFRQLPPSILLLTELPEEPGGYASYPNAVGFGYDHNSNDFKVVRIILFFEGAGDFHPSGVEVYDLSKDRWREIKTHVYGFVIGTRSFEMYHNGIYYWWATQNNRAIILSFDMSKEVFRQISVPEHIEDYRNEKSLDVWNGSIVLFHYPSFGDAKEFDIWAMDKDKDGWSKLLTIGPLLGFGIPLLFVNSDELLIETKDGQVISFSVNTKKIENLPIKGYPERSQGFVFVKSLLSVKGG